MRARSAYLVTSWWVVGVWVVLTILTGIISIISVLQPSWYVRYTLVHAQALQDVTFHVIVSSVGPLGYCRLLSVETHNIIDVTPPPSISKEELTTLSTDKDGITDDTDPHNIDMFSTTFPSVISEAISEASITIQTDNVQGEESSSSPRNDYPEYSMATEKEADTISDRDLVSPTEEIIAAGDNHEVLKHVVFTSINAPIRPTLPTPDFPLEIHVPIRSNNSDSVISKDSQISTIDNITFHERNDKIDSNILFSETGKYSKNIVEENTEDSLQTEKEKENVIDTSDVEEYTFRRKLPIYSEQDRDEGKREGKRNLVNNERNFMTKNTSGITQDFGLRQRGEKIHSSAERTRKKKKTKKKKKNRNKHNKKSRTKNKKKRKNQARNQHFAHLYDFSNRIRKKKYNSILVNPEPDWVNASLGDQLETSNVNINFTEEEILMEVLTRHERSTTFEEKSLDIHYRPRMPILACSGVTLGAGSGSSAVWSLVGVLYGIAGVVQVLVGMASVISHTVRSATSRYSHAILLGNIQVAVVMAQGVTLVLFPLGLGSPLARAECGGSSSVYWSGECTFGWAYMLAIVSTTLAAYCPCLARLTVYKKYALSQWESLNFF